MKFSNYLKEKMGNIIILACAIISIEIFLMIYPVAEWIRIYIAVVILGSYLLSCFIEWYQKKTFYTTIQNQLEELEQKYLITEMIPRVDFQEGKLLKEILEQTNKSMLENVNKYKYLQEDYKEYIELWIHEIKTPIATSKLMIENNKTEVTKNIDEELDKIENYIEQALFYARSNTVEKDYCVKKSSLQKIVSEVIRKNKKSLIQKKIKIEVGEIQEEVNTDSKWVVFILNQILQNSIQYAKEENAGIQIESKQGKERVVLTIQDNGIGIKQSEVQRVFEKGFTGSNGRQNGRKSTGIGLYLCKKLCDKLGLGMELDSIEGEGTQVKLIFPKGSFVLIEK